MEETYENGTNMPPWNLILTLENRLLTQPLVIKNRTAIGFLNLYNTEGEIKYRFQKEH